MVCNYLMDVASSGDSASPGQGSCLPGSLWPTPAPGIVLVHDDSPFVFTELMVKFCLTAVKVGSSGEEERPEEVSRAWIREGGLSARVEDQACPWGPQV